MIVRLCNDLLTSLIKCDVCHLCHMHSSGEISSDSLLCKSCLINIEELKLSNNLNTSCVICNQSSDRAPFICGPCHDNFNFNCNVRADSLYTYSSDIKKIIQAAKYNQNVQVTHFIYNAFNNHISNGPLRTTPLECILPIPSTERSVQKRGFHYIYYIAKKLSEHFSFPIIEFNDFYAEYCENEKRDPLSRLRNLHLRRYTIKTKNFSLMNKTVLIIDDVLTTGTSLISAIHTLQKYKVSNVYVLTFAKSSQFINYIRNIGNQFASAASQDILSF